MKTYDAMMIFLSSMQDDAVEKSLDRVKDEITKLNGKTSSVDILGERSFARRLKKKTGGRYVRLIFEMNPADVNALKARLKLNEEIFRVQICCAASEPAVAAGNKATA